MSNENNSLQSVDLASHEQAAISAYLRVQPFYEDLAGVIARLIQECLKKRRVKVHSVQHRAKDAGSFGRKAAIPSEVDPERAKYNDPLRDITDLAGVRVITHFPGTLTDIDQLLSDEFDILERSDKGVELIEDDKFGYQSIHYLVRLKPERVRLAEYERYEQAVAEVQVRTILQHAWAEIEHDIQYKSSKAIPSEIRRRFMALAGMLEIADREFQAIQDANRELEEHAKVMVQRGKLEGVEITPNALKLFLDKRLGPDGRISDWSYDWTARLLKRLGFQDLEQVESAIARYNDDHLSNVLFGTRQGQTTRFETMLLAALGERFIQRHPWHQSAWFVDRWKRELKKLQESEIEISTYDPVMSDPSVGAVESTTE
jgi:putative GTP pyrophosphokinase